MASWAGLGLTSFMSSEKAIFCCQYSTRALCEFMKSSNMTGR